MLVEASELRTLLPVGAQGQGLMYTGQEILKEEWFCSCECSIIYAALQRLVIHGEVQLQLSDLDIIKKHRESYPNASASANIRWGLLNSKTFGPEMKSLYTAEVSILHFSGKTVGILGLGRIGLAIAKRAEAFGCPISYYSRSEKLNTNYKYYTTVLDLAANCDVLVVAYVLTEETCHIVNRDVINALGPKGVLVNIGRGPYVDEPELVSALLEGRLGGAGLDVFEQEPHVPEKLFGLDNVVLLPHVGSGTVETRKAVADLVLTNLEAHVASKPLLRLRWFDYRWGLVRASILFGNTEE